MGTKKNILICPLDWGLGHASRCVPVIKELIRLGHHVIIGADKKPLSFLKQEFPELKTVVIPGYEIDYGEKGSSLKLFYESVKFYNFIKKEKQFMDAFLLENEIDMIVSDNRYGLYSDKVESIIITHQLYPKAPVGEKLLHQKIEELLSNFNEVWIPDYEDKNNLSGELSHLNPFSFPHKFIGPLSRFVKPIEEQEIEYDICAIISGPEPQRTIFEEMIIEQLHHTKLKAVLVRGLPDSSEELESKESGLKIFNHLRTKELKGLIEKSEVVLCRAGYSSIMDLAALGKKAILVPTPRQTEQEYLAKYHMEQGNFYMQNQNEFDLEKGLKELENYSLKFNMQDVLTLDFLPKND